MTDTHPDSVRVDVQGDPRSSTTMLVYGPEHRTSAVLILGHGAGAPQAAPFMVAFARGLSARGLTVVTFNFFYMEQRRRLPDPAPVLERGFRAVIDTARAQGLVAEGRPLVIGGKSMGGRIATHLAAADDETSAGIDGLVALGYPLHPPGRPDRLRSAHLHQIKVPMLIVQGSRDTFGTPEELAPILASVPHAELFVVNGGDHSFATAKKGAPARDEVYATIQDEIVEWVGRLT